MTNPGINRRSFLKLSGYSLAALALPTSQLSAAVRLFHSDYKYTKPINRFPTQQPKYYLTIDDGWFPEALERMLNSLKKAGQNATFFLVGDAARVAEGERPGIIRRLVEEGNEIGYHTVSHTSPKALSLNGVSWFIDDYSTWLEMMQGFVGEGIPGYGIRDFARAPGGFFSRSFIQFCEEMSQVPVGWNRMTGSVGFWQEEMHRGDILLMHVTPKEARFLDVYMSRLDVFAANGVYPAPFDLDPGIEIPTSSIID